MDKQEIIRLVRKNAYLKEGIDQETLLVALWEMVIERKPQAMMDIQKKRTDIKAKFPKV
jgi:hypothetical protein